MSAVHWRPGFPGGSAVKTPPGTPEMQFLSLRREDPLEKGTATHSSVLAWGIPRTEEPAGLESTGWQNSWIRLSD